MQLRQNSRIEDVLFWSFSNIRLKLVIAEKELLPIMHTLRRQGYRNARVVMDKLYVGNQLVNIADVPTEEPQPQLDLALDLTSGLIWDLSSVRLFPQSECHNSVHKDHNSARKDHSSVHKYQSLHRRHDFDPKDQIMTVKITTARGYVTGGDLIRRKTELT